MKPLTRVFRKVSAARASASYNNISEGYTKNSSYRGAKKKIASYGRSHFYDSLTIRVHGYFLGRNEIRRGSLRTAYNICMYIIIPRNREGINQSIRERLCRSDSELDGMKTDFSSTLPRSTQRERRTPAHRIADHVFLSLCIKLIYPSSLSPCSLVFVPCDFHLLTQLQTALPCIFI